MATIAALDASPLNLLRALRGVIADARVAYPDVLHIEIRDPIGQVWRLATQDADWSPTDPGKLRGRSIEDAVIDEGGELRLRLSDGSRLDVAPAPREAEDDPPSWELITPDGLVLEFGPHVRWQISQADARVSRA